MYLRLIPTLLLCFVFTVEGSSQTPSVSPTPSTPAEVTQRDKIRTFTEEVIIPVRVTDAQGRFDPSLAKDELLLLEDGTPQQITSVRHIPAQVLLLIGTAGELNPAMSVNVSKEIAAHLVSRLQSRDQCSVIQYGRDVEVIQPWSEDLQEVTKSIRTKLFSTKGNHLANALSAAVTLFKSTPVGNRHVVLITDGVEDGSEGISGLRQPITELLSQGVAVHIISYSQMGRRDFWKAQPLIIVTAKKPRKTAADIIAEILDPIGSRTEKPKLRVYIDTDVQMRVRRQRYLNAMKDGDRWLRLLALETAGVIFTPKSVGEMKSQAEEIADNIDSQYVVAYRPTRPLVQAEPGEYRRIEVASRRVGLFVFSRRGYVVPQIRDRSN